MTQPVSLLVTPSYNPLPQIEVAPGGRAGEGRPRPYAPEQTVSAQTTRPYIPGDSLYQSIGGRQPGVIHYTCAPSKAARPGTGGSCWISRRACKPVKGRNPHLNMGLSWLHRLPTTACEWAERLAWRSKGSGWSGLSLGKAKPGVGRFAKVGSVKPGQRPLEELLKLLETKHSADASLVIITPNAGIGWLQGLLPLIWKGAVPTVLLLDPAAFGGQSDIHRAGLELASWGNPFRADYTRAARPSGSTSRPYRGDGLARYTDRSGSAAPPTAPGRLEEVRMIGEFADG